MNHSGNALFWTLQSRSLFVSVHWYLNLGFLSRLYCSSFLLIDSHVYLLIPCIRVFFVCIYSLFFFMSLPSLPLQALHHWAMSSAETFQFCSSKSWKVKNLLPTSQLSFLNRKRFLVHQSGNALDAELVQLITGIVTKCKNALRRSSSSVVESKFC